MGRVISIKCRCCLGSRIVQEGIQVGKEITGFTDAEEKLSVKRKKVPFKAEDEVVKCGADFQKRLPFFKGHSNNKILFIGLIELPLLS